jgi:hypothetical protein
MGQYSQATHKGAANTQYMNVHETDRLLIKTLPSVPHTLQSVKHALLTVSVLPVMKIAGNWRIMRAIVKSVRGLPARWPLKTHSMHNPVVLPPL